MCEKLIFKDLDTNETYVFYHLESAQTHAKYLISKGHDFKVHYERIIAASLSVEVTPYEQVV